MDPFQISQVAVTSERAAASLRRMLDAEWCQLSCTVDEDQHASWIFQQRIQPNG